jgi:hypothetical protein
MDGSEALSAQIIIDLEGPEGSVSVDLDEDPKSCLQLET